MRTVARTATTAMDPMAVVHKPSRACDVRHPASFVAPFGASGVPLHVGVLADSAPIRDHSPHAEYTPVSPDGRIRWISGRHRRVARTLNRGSVTTSGRSPLARPPSGADRPWRTSAIGAWTSLRLS
ncbi:hypothetical protein Acsp06_07720 [Actinomycetospora sp. NBRC 106375]|nr:hypothetical protein Acsp06_07720 [Actinomycetospora sp. NBRC 106375]